MGWGTDGHNSATCGRVSGTVCPSSASGSTCVDRLTHAEEPGLDVRRFYARGAAPSARMSVSGTDVDSVPARCSRVQESIVRTRFSDRRCTASREMADSFQDHAIVTTSDSLSAVLSTCASADALSVCDRCSDISRMQSKMRSPHSLSRRNSSRPAVGPTASILCVLVIFTLACTPVTASMHIKAFEYQHKFKRTLELGECPQRELVNPRNGTYKTYRTEACSLLQVGNITTLENSVTDYRNVLITAASEIVKYIGLCGGEAASYLGILNKGDCVSVEIASKLTFSEKTMVRAFVGYYRKSNDVLESSATVIKPGMENYYKDKYYLRNRSYGTVEIIFVQFRFRSEKDKDDAKKVELRSPIMSHYMKAIKDRVETPAKVTLISLSTSSQDPFKLKKFDMANWDRAVREVEIQEMFIEKTMSRIRSNEIKPHLEYEFFPFIDSAVFRNPNPLTWEDTSMLEVSLDQAFKQARKSAKLCQGNKHLACKRIRELRRSLKETLAEVHRGRSNWVNMTMEEKSAFSKLHSSKSKSYINLTESLSKEVIKMVLRIKNRQKNHKLRKTDCLKCKPLRRRGHKSEQEKRRRRQRQKNKLIGRGDVRFAR
ncbi:unnamed protein product [Lymnaea stagnalis]|uniref:Uncharacterized protein n=1 Tax=Lymnaea stagnalis TaxID=6523 RepID=A0AAV2INJ4_LYMST